MHTSYNSAQAKDYFTESLNRGDYYSEGQEMAGRWGGKLRENLGLSEEVRQEDFFALCDNEMPGTGDRLTPRTKDGRRVGYDINFHLPKSATLLYALGGDRGILDAFRSAVSDTMRELEAEMRTRVRMGGQTGDRLTENMVWAEFIHTTSRPVDAVPDPHLHSHCFTFNVTHDPVEDRFKAGEFHQLKRKATYYEARFHVRMADRMKGLGYDIRTKGKFWEVDGIPDKLVEEFSRRTTQINKAAADLGLENDPERKAGLGAKTREKKQKDDSFEELREGWQERAGTAGMDAVNSAKRRKAEKAEERGGTGARQPLDDRKKANEAERAVAFAIAHTFERKSAVTERHLAEVALRNAFGKSSLEYIDAALARKPLIRRVFKGEDWVTTEEVLREEQQMVAFASGTRGRCSRFVDGVYELKDKSLNNGQKGAIRHVLNSYDQVVLIRGGAGTGKTRLMTEAISAIEKSGSKVVVLAPLSDTARQTLPKEGFKDAQTIAAYLVNAELQEKFRGGVLWVDEAGLLGTRTMNQLFQVAQQQKCRVVLSGDPRQHKSVERGDALDLLVEEGGMEVAEVKAVVRQKGEYKEACEHLNKGDTAAGWKKLDELGFIKEVAGDDGIDKAHEQLAEEYVDAIRARKTVHASSPTHVEGEKVSQTIREKLKDAGFVSRREREVTRFKPLNLTEAQKLDQGNFKPGMVVQFHQKSRGKKAGERAEVVGTWAGQVWVKGIAGGALPLAVKLSDAKKFSVYAKDVISLAVGDKIRITCNGKTAGDLLGFLPDRRNPLRSAEQLLREFGQSMKRSKKQVHPDPRRLNNGATYRVIGFIPLSGDIVLNNGWVVPKNFGHITHDYCSTSPAVQSKTFQRQLVAQTSMSFGAASNRAQFLVCTSRGSESVSIYTDKKQALKEQVEKGTERISGTKVLMEGEVSTAEKVRRYREHMEQRRNGERTKEKGRDYDR